MEINTNEVFLPLVHKVQSYAGKNTGDDGAGPLSPLHKGKVQKNNLLSCLSDSNTNLFPFLIH